MNQPIRALDHPIMLFDGTAVNDLGAAAAAAILLLPNGRRYTVSQYLGRGTEIQAEYTGLLIGLKKARQLGLRELDIKGDSESVFNQVNGLEPVTDPDLQSLCRETRVLMDYFDRVELERISPEQNRSAVAAVNRCIGEALGKEKNSPPSLSLALAPAIARLVQLGAKATARDYRDLETPADDLSEKSLARLQELVPEAERDSIALQWDGNEERLADIYRWYCRGLPASMALKKVALDAPQVPEKTDKLPWEGQLDGRGTSPVETSDLSLSSPLFEAPLDTPPLFPAPARAPKTILPSLPVGERDTLLSIPSGFLSDPEATGTTDPEVGGDPTKDTLPATAKVRHVREMMETLSEEERELLIAQLVQSPDWVTLFLRTIAERAADR